MPGIEFELYVDALREQLRRGGFTRHNPNLTKRDRRLAGVGCAVVAACAASAVVASVAALIIFFSTDPLPSSRPP